MAKPSAQQCHALTTYFNSKFQEKVGRAAATNRNKARWGFESMLMDYSPVSARELIDYYVEYYENPSLDWFLYNYEKVDAAKMEHDQTQAAVAARREATAKRLEEWRNRWKKS